MVYMTARDKSEAKKLGKALVEKKLAGCVNILEGMESYYWWEGKIEHGKEAVLIAKTRASTVKQLLVEVKKLHSYSCPCVLALPVEDGNPDYIKWLSESMAGEGELAKGVEK
jgi:periplasmic divalent cation tolerance protein